LTEKEIFEISVGTEAPNPAIKNIDSASVHLKKQDSSESSTNSRYHPYGYNKAKTPNPEVDMCGIVHLSNLQIDQLNNKKCFGADLPILTLSMAKMLTISALSKDMHNICNVINQIGYYMQQSWRAYKSHRKKTMQLIEARAPL